MGNGTSKTHSAFYNTWCNVINPDTKFSVIRSTRGHTLDLTVSTVLQEIGSIDTTVSAMCQIFVGTRWRLHGIPNGYDDPTVTCFMYKFMDDYAKLNGREKQKLVSKTEKFLNTMKKTWRGAQYNWYNLHVDTGDRDYIRNPVTIPNFRILTTRAVNYSKVTDSEFIRRAWHITVNERVPERTRREFVFSRIALFIVLNGKEHIYNTHVIRSVIERACMENDGFRNFKSRFGELHVTYMDIPIVLSSIQLPDNYRNILSRDTVTYSPTLTRAPRTHPLPETPAEVHIQETSRSVGGPGDTPPSASFHQATPTITHEPEESAPAGALQCVVCHDREIVLTYTCGHRCICQTCASHPSMKNTCPVCRHGGAPFKVIDYGIEGRK